MGSKQMLSVRTPPTILQVPNAAEIFNWSVVSYAISAAWEVGLLDRLQEEGRLNVHAFSKRQGLDAPLLTSLLKPLAMADIVVLSPDATEVTPGAIFVEVNSTKALFHWLHRGSGNLLTQLGRVVRGDSEGTQRNARAISVASSEANAAYFNPVFQRVLADLEFNVVADLGCGAGQRLIDVVTAVDGTRALGLEIQPSSVSLAQARVAAAGVEDRVEILQRDVTTLSYEEAFSSVDLLTCFLLGHDLWPRENALDVLHGLTKTFPSVKALIFCDTVRLEHNPSPRESIFSSGFEMVHAAMGQYIPTAAEWLGLFIETGWRCMQRHEFEVPSATVLFHLVPAEAHV